MNFRTQHTLIVAIYFLLSSCAMENRKNKNTDEYFYEPIEEKNSKTLNDFDGITDDYDKEVITTFLKESSLVSLKLQDFYDLIALQNQHPEFSKEVKTQLKTFTNDSLNLYPYKNTKAIQNIRQVGSAKSIDSITTKVRYAYDMISDRNKKTDTVWAIITSKIITIDDETLVSYKVKFSKN